MHKDIIKIFKFKLCEYPTFNIGNLSKIMWYAQSKKVKWLNTFNMIYTENGRLITYTHWFYCFIRLILIFMNAIYSQEIWCDIIEWNIDYV